MATVIGQSGAWHAIVLGVGRCGHSISSPEEIEPLAARLKEERQGALDAHRAATMGLVQERSAQVVELNDTRGFLVRFLNRHKVRRLRYQIAALYADDKAFGTHLDWVIQRIAGLPGSAELAGAHAELEVSERLRLLPDSFVVFNDVHLRATRTIRYEGAYLQSAQLDHVVLGPTGVFVIETKCWSRATAESDSHHDPFDQSARAGYLCFDLLRQAFGTTRVRSVIAHLGSLPAAPRDTKVHAVRPENLRSFIAEYGYGREELSAGQIEQLCPFFERRVVTKVGATARHLAATVL